MEPELAYHAYGLCERVHEGFFGEPLNALSNGFFFLVAIRLSLYFRGLTLLKVRHVWDIRLLLAMIPMIGLSSFLFHTMPSEVTESLDLTFIISFILIYFTSAVFRIVRVNATQAVVCFLAYAGSTHILVSQFPNAMNDSIGYLSTMAALIFIAFYLDRKKRAAARDFLIAALVGVISLFFRSVDHYACAKLPIGTHFLWHSLNALLIYLLMKQLIRSVTRKPRKRGARLRKALISPSVTPEAHHGFDAQS